MSLSRFLALTLGLTLLVPSLADAKKKKADEEEEPAEDEEADSEGDADAEPADEKPEADAEPEAEPEEDKPIKQNLSGHDLGTTKKKNEFEKDRFFVDKVDTEKTAKGTLIQGSLQSTSFLYTESGGNYERTLDTIGSSNGSNAARFSRLYTELRLQTDFRHISASRWDARIDARARVVNQPEQNTDMTMSPDGTFSDDPNHVQSGFNGTNEYDVRELWLFRSGKRTDFFFGRQFVPDLGGVKFDGIRLDYAKSHKFTLIGFGGLYPVRGSRSLSTDYKELRTETGESAGRLVGTGGFGAAYRTSNAYGAFGGVAMAPLKGGEQPRLFATSTGYWRYGSTLDIYHFALLDLYGSQTVDGTTSTKAGAGVDFTNLSGGVNYKPSQRLRITGAYNRVDVDTLAVQAYAFLDQPDPMGTNVQNDTFFRRLATTSVRGGISAGLGEQQRFEISVGAAYRYRKTIRLPVPSDPNGVLLQGTRGVEVTGSIVDRRSIKGARIGIDVVRTFGLGDGTSDIAFMRSEVFAGRLSVSRDLANGHGEWEGEVAYSTAKDSASGTNCFAGTTAIIQCYGSSKSAIISFGGTLNYRLNRDWFVLGSLFLTRQTLESVGNVDPAGPPPMPLADPSVTGLTGFGRIAYRF